MSHSGEPKVLYPGRAQAHAAGGNAPSHVKMWQTYKCPSKLGWHVASVHWDPWEDLTNRTRERTL